MRRDETLWAWSAPGSDRAFGPFGSRDEALDDARDSEEPRVLLGQVAYLEPADYAWAVDADHVCAIMTAAVRAFHGWREPRLDLPGGVRRRPAQIALETAIGAWASTWLVTTDWRLAEDAVEVDVPTGGTP